MNMEKKIRILVAEDETIIRLDLVEMLTEAGYEVVAQAENGALAIELVKLHKPDLAILDVKMPEMDGITAAEQIISLAPVLMLTAFSQRDLVERARKELGESPLGSLCPRKAPQRGTRPAAPSRSLCSDPKSCAGCHRFAT